MFFIEMKTLHVEPVPVPIGNTHPKMDAVLPQHEFSMGLIAPKGAGKTTMICNLLRFYKGYFHTIYVFSPTVQNDDKWDWFRGLTQGQDAASFSREQTTQSVY
jgi:ABC-type multidrug transport system ATPase subunit